MREAREGGEEGEEEAPAAEEDVDIGKILYCSCEGGRVRMRVGEGG